jgi:xanthine dehydrogenase accessory factor
VNTRGPAAASGVPARLGELRILIRGAGEMATGTACRLFRSGFRRLFMTEIKQPRAVRRLVSFSEAVYEGTWTVEGVTAVRIENPADAEGVWQCGRIPVMVDPTNFVRLEIEPHVLVDAILAKENFGTTMHHAPLVLAFGPGFVAGRDAHCVVETNRGHDLGRLIFEGEAAANTGVPGDIAGESHRRVIRAPADGVFTAEVPIATEVTEGRIVGRVNGVPVTVELSGTLRGLIRSGIAVPQGLKLGDVDPRNVTCYCHTISEKARGIGGSVLEAILMRFNG